jgi:transcriptional regulator NrdR family protein
MNCPHCGSGDTRVVSTIGAVRRRECFRCQQRFNTEERLQAEWRSYELIDAAIGDLIKLKEGAL